MRGVILLNKYLHCEGCDCIILTLSCDVRGVIVLTLYLYTCIVRGVIVAVLVFPISEMMTRPSSVVASAGPRHSKNTWKNTIFKYNKI